MKPDFFCFLCACIIIWGQVISSAAVLGILFPVAAAGGLVWKQSGLVRAQGLVSWRNTRAPPLLPQVVADLGPAILLHNSLIK